MNTRFKVYASYNILQYPCGYIHVLIFVTVSKCQKSPKLTNIVMIDLPVGMSNGVVCEATRVSVTMITELKKSLNHHEHPQPKVSWDAAIRFGTLARRIAFL